MTRSNRNRLTFVPSTPTSPITPRTPITPYSPLTSTRRTVPPKTLKTYLLKSFKFIEQRIFGWFASMGVTRGDPIELKHALAEMTRKRISGRREERMDKEEGEKTDGIIGRRCSRKLTVVV